MQVFDLEIKNKNKICKTISYLNVENIFSGLTKLPKKCILTMLKGLM